MTIEMHQHSKMVSCESGQTMTEYSLVLGLIVLVTIATFTVLGGRVEQVLGLVLGIFSA
jgi:Flp pilus assembly pilin Flp